ncbi:hypothetical protein PENTCL1PPCAC_5606, partial [Pristionchus entomophagus]
QALPSSSITSPLASRPNNVFKIGDGSMGQPNSTLITDGSTSRRENMWDPNSYGTNDEININSNSSFTGLDWMNEVDLSKFREEIAPDILQYRNPSPEMAFLASSSSFRLTSRPNNVFKMDNNSMGHPYSNPIKDGSTLEGASMWDPTRYDRHLNTNYNSNSSFTGLAWRNRDGLSKFIEEKARDMRNYRKSSPQTVPSRKKFQDERMPSYPNMVALALMSSATGQLYVTEIYTFICKHFPYFRTAPKGWKNSVRHILSCNETFHKSEIKPKRDGRMRCLWSINPDKQEKVDANLAKWQQNKYTEETEAIE